MGILPTTPVQVVDFSALAVPPALEGSVDQVIDRALVQRPDLIAKVAVMREKEAVVRRARADYFPTLSLVTDVGGQIARTRYELRFQSLFHTGRALTFPCDDRGEVHWDTLSERARSSFLRAQDGVGIEFATPAVQLSDLH